jgi:hypothetical protein
MSAHSWCRGCSLVLILLVPFHCLCCQQPAMLFVGDRFESDADFKLARSMLLDMFRGKQVRTCTLSRGALVTWKYCSAGGSTRASNRHCSGWGSDQAQRCQQQVPGLVTL